MPTLRKPQNWPPDRWVPRQRNSPNNDGDVDRMVSTIQHFSCTTSALLEKPAAANRGNGMEYSSGQTTISPQCRRPAQGTAHVRLGNSGGPDCAFGRQTRYLPQDSAQTLSAGTIHRDHHCQHPGSPDSISDGDFRGMPGRYHLLDENSYALEREGQSRASQFCLATERGDFRC
jgi:hypothetical protein